MVYDKHAAIYDRLIGSELYNRLAWGSSPKSYALFAKRAIEAGTGILLDAGCGSLVSTVEMHIQSCRPTLLCDLSGGMLAAARDRIVSVNGTMPDHLLLLQADLTELPFNDASFGSVLCPGMLHIFEQVEKATLELARVATDGATLFMSSLVAETWISARYLALLHRAGEVASPRNSRDLMARLSSPNSGLRSPIAARLEGSMLFISANASRSDI